MQRSRGFTLIELLIVVAIVAILTAIALPSYNESVRKARRAQAKTDMLEIVQMLERRYTTERTYVGFVAPTGFEHSPHDGTVRYNVTGTDAADLTATTYTLTATPVGGDSDDPRCGTLTINHRGVKTASGSGTVSDCW